MNIINQSYEIVTLADWDTIEKHIERCGRICYKSEDRIANNSADTFIRNLIDRGHESVIEHAMITAFITTDRGISHELVRHRLASYSQESTRYCNYSNDKFGNEITFISIVNGIALDTKMSELPQDIITETIEEWCSAMMDAERHYNRMIELGATPQIARSVLPNSTKTDIAVTANPRQWRNILKQRTAKGAHPQMRELMIMILQTLQRQCAVLFGDIEY